MTQVVNWTTNVRKRNWKATTEKGKKPHHFLDFLFLADARDKCLGRGNYERSSQSIDINPEALRATHLKPPPGPKKTHRWKKTLRTKQKTVRTKQYISKGKTLSALKRAGFEKPSYFHTNNLNVDSTNTSGHDQKMNVATYPTHDMHLGAYPMHNINTHNMNISAYAMPSNINVGTMNMPVASFNNTYAMPMQMHGYHVPMHFSGGFNPYTCTSKAYGPYYHSAPYPCSSYVTPQRYKDQGFEPRTEEVEKSPVNYLPPKVIKLHQKTGKAQEIAPDKQKMDLEGKLLKQITIEGLVSTPPRHEEDDMLWDLDNDSDVCMKDIFRPSNITMKDSLSDTSMKDSWRKSDVSIKELLNTDMDLSFHAENDGRSPVTDKDVLKVFDLEHNELEPCQID